MGYVILLVQSRRKNTSLKVSSITEFQILEGKGEEMEWGKVRCYGSIRRNFDGLHINSVGEWFKTKAKAIHSYNSLLGPPRILLRERLFQSESGFLLKSAFDMSFPSSDKFS